jgi:hypothetical protein
MRGRCAASGPVTRQTEMLLERLEAEIASEVIGQKKASRA